jgi:outer membrane lipoprotein-sorting protein
MADRKNRRISTIAHQNFRIAGSIFFLLLSMQCSRVNTSLNLSTQNISILEIIARVESNYHKLQTFQGNAQVSIETSQMGLTASGRIAITMPDSLLLEMRAGLGMSLGSVFIEARRFTLYDPSQNKTYTGCIDSVAQRHLLPIDISSVDLLHTAAGTPTIRRTPNDSLTCDKDKYVFITYQRTGSTRFWIDPKKWVITDVVVTNNRGDLTVQQEYRQFSRLKGVYLPKLIRVLDTKSKQRISFFYTDRSVNKKIKKSHFVQRIPESTEWIKLN